MWPFPEYLCRHLSASCPLTDRSVPFHVGTLSLSLLSVFLLSVSSLAPRRARDPDEDIPYISCFPASWPNLSPVILFLFSISHMFHPCFDSVDISLSESSVQSCTTNLPLQRDEVPPLPWFCPLTSCPTNPLSIVSPEESPPLSSREESLWLIVETHHLLPIVFQACPRLYIPVVVPCPQAGWRSISVAPQTDILGLYPWIPDGYEVHPILVCLLVSPTWFPISRMNHIVEVQAQTVFN